MKTINGVAIPGQWLTEEYKQQKRAEHNHPEPPRKVVYTQCDACDLTYLVHHTCPHVVKQNRVRAKQKREAAKQQRREALETRLHAVRETNRETMGGAPWLEHTPKSI